MTPWGGGIARRVPEHTLLPELPWAERPSPVRRSTGCRRPSVPGTAFASTDGPANRVDSAKSPGRSSAPTPTTSSCCSTTRNCCRAACDPSSRRPPRCPVRRPPEVQSGTSFIRQLFTMGDYTWICSCLFRPAVIGPTGVREADDRPARSRSARPAGHPANPQREPEPHPLPDLHPPFGAGRVQRWRRW